MVPETVFRFSEKPFVHFKAVSVSSATIGSINFCDPCSQCHEYGVSVEPPGKVTIHVENVDEFKWLNSSYCLVLRQLGSAAMKAFYFNQGHPSTLSSGSSNIKYRNPKYLSMFNHLRFYLPEVYPKSDKILFLDDDIVVQKDSTGLWSVNLHKKMNGAVHSLSGTKRG
ncbi:unnamed protein product, partial [Vitis vinifera]